LLVLGAGGLRPQGNLLERLRETEVKISDGSRRNAQKLTVEALARALDVPGLLPSAVGAHPSGVGDEAREACLRPPVRESLGAGQAGKEPWLAAVPLKQLRQVGVQDREVRAGVRAFLEKS